MADAELETAVQAALAEPAVRVRRLDLPDGRRFWLKRVEHLAGRMRLQKGDPARSFEAEREGVRALQAEGLPVAGLVAEGPGWMVLPDAGPTLAQVVADPLRDEAAKRTAMAAAGRALALLHWAGMAHGRPAVRDICWDGTVARFIDLERFRRVRRGGFWQAVDLVVLAQTGFTTWPDTPGWLEAAFTGYREAAPEGAMRNAARLGMVLTPLGWVARGLLHLRPASRELRAFGLMLPWLRRQG